MKPNNSKYTILKYCSFIIAIIAVNQILIIGSPISANIYYALMGAGLILSILLSFNKVYFSGLMSWILVAALISLIANPIPVVFRAHERLLTFIIMSSLIGPFICSPGLILLRITIFKYLNWILIGLVVLSSIFYFLHIPLPNKTVFYSGLVNHSMLLGPIAAISLILLLYLRTKNKPGNISIKIKWLLYLAIILSLASLLLASSRVAIIGGIAGAIFFLYKIFQDRISSFLGVIVFIILIGMASFSFWSNLSSGILKKQTISTKHGDYAASRRSNWNERIAEFQSSPVFGIGFATMKQGKQKSGILKTGTIEPGSSWLAILSMIGIFGFIPVLILFIRNLVFLIKDRSNVQLTALLGGLLFFFIMHMFAEGYFLAAGNFMFFYVWLLLGIIEIYRNNQKIVII